MFVFLNTTNFQLSASIEVMMSVKNCKYFSVKVTWGHLCRDFWARIPTVATYFSSTNGGMLQASNRPRNLPASHASNACSKTLDVPFHFAVPVANFKPKLQGSACTPCGRPIILCNLCSFAFTSDDKQEVFKILAEHVKKLFACRGNHRPIRYVSRSQPTEPYSLRASSPRVSDRTREGNHDAFDARFPRIRSMVVSAFHESKPHLPKDFPNPAQASSAKDFTRPPWLVLFEVQMFAISGESNVRSCFLFSFWCVY